MNTYLIQWEPKSEGIPWHHEFEMMSDDLAKAWTKAQMDISVEMRLVPQAILLFRMGEHQALISRLVRRRMHDVIDETINDKESSALLVELG